MKAWLGTRTAAAVAIAISLLFALPSLRLGFVTDDQGFRARLHSDRAPAAWDLFAFQNGDPIENGLLVRYGRLPWWSAPDLQIRFARPLTGELFAADDAAFGDNAVLYHVHSLAWFALLLVGVAALFRALAQRGRLAPEAATLALLCFGLAGAHAQGYAWLSARHVLVGAAGVAWALALYERTDSRWRWLAILPLVIGMLGSEAALGGVPLWLALAWQRGNKRDLAIPFALGIVYLVAYTHFGFGTHSSGGYHDPIHEPLAFLRVAIARIPVLLADGFLGLPVALNLVAISLAALILFAAAWRYAGTNLLLFAAAGFLALLPGVAGFPTGRVLIVPDLAFCAVLGAIIARAADKKLLIILAAARFAWAPIYSLGEQKQLAIRGARTDRIAREAKDLVPEGGRAVLIASADPFVYLYPRAVLAETNPHWITCWSTLSGVRGPHTLTRLTDRSFRLEPTNPFLTGFDALFRTPSLPLAIGDPFEQCGGQITITSLSPPKLEIRYQRALDDPKLTFLTYTTGHLARFTFPAINASTTID
ncbi:MAG: hypothetical protein QM831_26770 [Kofleriaceae bacterium]